MEQRWYVDLGGSKIMSSCGGKLSVMILVDDVTLMKSVRFLQKKSDTKAELKSFSINVVNPASIKISGWWATGSTMGWPSCPWVC